jgi:hypothetical protein
VKKVYLIIDPTEHASKIMKAFYFYRWDWIDEFPETEKTPHTLIYIDDETETYIYHREENKNVFQSRYFYVEGENIESTLEMLHAAANILDIKDLIKKYNESDVPLERGSAIYQLGIALCGSAFDSAIYDVFEIALKDNDSGVRIAALAGMAWLGWEEMLPLIEEAKKDSCIDVSSYAKTLQEGLAFGKVCRTFIYAVKEEDVEEQKKKFQAFNTLCDELMDKFPRITLEAVAKEAALELNIEFEQALEDGK